jgi:hypothetical protein
MVIINNNNNNNNNDNIMAAGIDRCCSCNGLHSVVYDVFVLETSVLAPHADPMKLEDVVTVVL